MINLSFGQNDYPIGGSFWPKDSLISRILFELCLFRYLAQSTYFRDTLYSTSTVENKKHRIFYDQLQYLRTNKNTWKIFATRLHQTANAGFDFSWFAALYTASILPNSQCLQNLVLYWLKDKTLCHRLKSGISMPNVSRHGLDVYLKDKKLCRFIRAKI